MEKQTLIPQLTVLMLTSKVIKLTERKINTPPLCFIFGVRVNSATVSGSGTEISSTLSQNCYVYSI